MKKCTGCGSYYSDFDRVCPHCGKADETIPEEKEVKQDTIRETAEERIENWTGEESGNDQMFDPRFRHVVQPAEIINTSPYPMKWHRALMVLMIIGGVLNIFSGLSVMMLGVNIILGMASVGIGTFQMIVRNRLQTFRKDAIQMLMIFFATSIAVNVISEFAVSAMAGEGVAIGTMLAEVVGMVLYASVNYVYYNKRRELFKY